MLECLQAWLLHPQLCRRMIIDCHGKPVALPLSQTSCMPCMGEDGCLQLFCSTVGEGLHSAVLCAASASNF